jgi:hypothetical protein
MDVATATLKTSGDAERDGGNILLAPETTRQGGLE